MKRIAEILSRFLRAANASWMLAASAFAFTPTTPQVFYNQKFTKILL